MTASIARVGLVALLVVMLDGVSAPHIHDPFAPGVYDHEHDFYLAVLSSLSALSTALIVIPAPAGFLPASIPDIADVPPRAPSCRTTSRDPPRRGPGSG